MKVNEKMKKMVFLALMLALLAGSAHSQIRIGKQEKPVAGAVLDLKSPPPGGYVGGLVLPNVEITDVNDIPNNFINYAQIELDKLAGLLVYNATESPSVPKGVYVWNGTKWVKIN